MIRSCKLSHVVLRFTVTSRARLAEEVKEDEVPTGDACTLFGKFWEPFGRAMKLGMIEDTTNR